MLYMHIGSLIPMKFTDALGLAWCSGRALLSFRVVKFRHYPFFPGQLTTFMCISFLVSVDYSGDFKTSVVIYLARFSFFQFLSSFFPDKIDITTCINF